MEHKECDNCAVCQQLARIYPDDEICHECGGLIDDYDPVGPIHGSPDDPCEQKGFHFHLMLPDGQVFTRLNSKEPWRVGRTVEGPVADPQPRQEVN